MVTKKTPKVVLTAVAIVIAAYILSPFYLVLINTFKNANGIVANPVSFAGASFAQFKTNISNVVNNSNFSFWSAFGIICDHYSCSLYYLLYSVVWLRGLSAVTRQMVNSYLHDIYRIHDNSFPGSYASSGFYIP